LGFETENEIENAKGKIQKKNLDLIVLNSLRPVQVLRINQQSYFIDKNFIEPMELKSKAVADDILNKVIANFL
jgi:phosphopantothenoylcysteine decarboxylase/phosphopantothenate--cysteine ligase